MEMATDGGSSLLHLNPQKQPSATVELSGPQHRLHARFQRVREHVILALRNDTRPRSDRRARRLDGCCFNPEVRKRADGRPLLVLGVCRDRLCPRCQIARGKAVAERILALTHDFDSPRFATFTLAHRGEDCGTMLDRLHHAFRKMRQTPEWKEHVRGGVYVLQTTRDERKKQWHVHLHVITDGVYWPQALLAKLWHKVTGDSKIVDIRAVPDRRRVAKYVSDYVAKPADMLSWSWAAVAEFAEAMHGRRLVHTFGTAHGAAMEDDADAGDADSGEFITDALTLSKAARRGDQRASFARNTLASLGRDWGFALADDGDFHSHGPMALPPADIDAALSLARLVYVDPAPPRPPAAPPPTPRQAQLMDVGPLRR
jgi:replication protein